MAVPKACLIFQHVLSSGVMTHREKPVGGGSNLLNLGGDCFAVLAMTSRGYGSKDPAEGLIFGQPHFLPIRSSLYLK